MLPLGHGDWLLGRIPVLEAHLSVEDGHLTLLQRVPGVHAWLLAQLP